MTTPSPADDQQQGQAAEKPAQGTVRVPAGQPDPFGRYHDYIEAESEEAAAHWDATRWTPWSGR